MLISIDYCLERVRNNFSPILYSCCGFCLFLFDSVISVLFFPIISASSVILVANFSNIFYIFVIQKTLKCLPNFYLKFDDVLSDIIWVFSLVHFNFKLDSVIYFLFASCINFDLIAIFTFVFFIWDFPIPFTLLPFSTPHCLSFRLLTFLIKFTHQNCNLFSQSITLLMSS